MIFGKKKLVVESEAVARDEKVNSLVRRVDKEEKLMVWKYEEEDLAMGAVVVVHPSQRALFVKNGELLGVLEPGEHVMDPESVSFLQRVVMKLSGREPFIHAQIYFVEETIQMAIPWGLGDIRFLDPVSNMPMDIGANGEMAIQVNPYQVEDFVKEIVGTQGKLDQETLISYFKGKIISLVRGHLAMAIKEMGINIFEIDGYLPELSDQLLSRIKGAIEKYGLLVKEFYIMKIKLPDDEKFRQLSDTYSSNYLTRAKIEHDRLKVLSAADLKAEEARINAMSEAEIMKIQADANAYKRKWENYTWKDEKEMHLEERKLDIAAENARNPQRGRGGYEPGAGMGFGGGMGFPGNQGAPAPDAWTCSCGARNTGRFCQNCGSPKPAAGGWTCTCGTQNTGRFCQNCGSPRPAESGSWTCSCGTVNHGAFCGNCGKARG